MENQVEPGGPFLKYPGHMREELKELIKRAQVTREQLERACEKAQWLAAQAKRARVHPGSNSPSVAQPDEQERTDSTKPGRTAAATGRLKE